MKQVTLTLALLLLLGTVVQSAQWSTSTVLSDGTVLYASVSTGNITVDLDNQCKCDYSIQWFTATNSEKNTLANDSTQVHTFTNHICFTSSAKEYPDSSVWLDNVDIITQSYLKDAVSSFLKQQVDVLEKKQGAQSPVISTFPVGSVSE